MVAIVSGSSLGLSLSSWATMGQQGQIGSPSLGQNGEQAFVNITTGNLILQDRDDVFQALGTEVAALRTYNSQGLLDDDNGDNWTTGAFKGGSIRYTGTTVSQSSTIYRKGADGAETAYYWDSSASAYLCARGAGAYDSIKYSGLTQAFTWTDGDTGAAEKYTKNALGKYVLSTATDARGNTVTYTYDSLGQIQKVQASTGDSFTFDYRGGTQLASVVYTSAAGTNSTVARYDYHADGKLKAVTVDLSPEDNSVADGNVYKTQYWYDGAGNLFQVDQADGTRINFGYESDSTGKWRVSSVTDGIGRTTTFSYDKQNRRTTVIDAQQRQTVYAYDLYGRLVTVTAPPVNGTSQVTTFTYADSNSGVGSQLATVTDALGRQVAMSYDAYGNQTLQRDAAGNTITRTFDSYNQVTTEAVYLVPDPDGAGAAQPSQPLVTRYVYDGTSKRLLRFVLSPEGRVTEYRYDALGERTATLQYALDKYDVSALGTTAVPTLAALQTWASSRGAQVMRTDYAYDYRGLLWTATQWAQVDANGSGVSDGNQSMTTYVRDYEGKLRQTISGTGATTTYTYDGLGRVLTAQNAQNELTVTTYDAGNNTIRVTQANGLVTSRVYDAAGQLVSVRESSATASDLGTTRYFYDTLGRVAMTQDPTGVRSWALYDEAGRKVADIDGDGSLTEYRYNAANLLTHTIAYATRVSTAVLVGAAGQPTNPALASIRPGASADDRHAWRVYDAANRLVGEVDATGAVVVTAYDGASRVTSVKAYATRIAVAALADAPTLLAVTPGDSEDDRTARRYYDADGRLCGELDGEGFLTEYQYDASGRLSRKRRYATPTAHAATFSQVIPASNPADQVTTYLYNAKGQVAGEIDAEGYLTEKVYDKDGRLAQSIRYATKVSAAYTAASPVADVRPVGTAQDQSSTWQYDGLGRVIQQTDFQGTITQFSYDNAGNLVKTVRAWNQPEARTLQARYDVQGRLVAELAAEGCAQLTGNQTPAEIDAIWAQWGITHTYDAADRRTSTTDQYGNRTLFFYNPDGQLTHTVNALGEVTENQYDGLGRRAAVIKYGARIGLGGLTGGNAGGLVNGALTLAIDMVRDATQDGKTTYTYFQGPWSSGYRETDALGFETFHYSNAFGEEFQTSRTLGASGSYTVTRLYDRRGLQVRQSHAGTNASAHTSIEYDAFGRVKKTIDANNETHLYTWDHLGRQVSITDPLDATTYTAYDAFDRVLSRTDAMGAVTQYAYDAAQRAVTVTSPEGIVTRTVFTRFGQTQSVTDGRGNTTTYTYDKDGHLKETRRADLSVETTGYDRAGRIAETTDASGNKVAFTYDALNRVFTRTVDPGGLNLVTRSTWGVRQLTTTSPAGVVTRFDYDLKGQLKAQVVDPGGLNLVTSYTYDGDSNVLTVTSPGGALTKYTYDTLGRRTMEQVDPAGLNLTRSWEYDGENNLMTSTDANGQLTRYVRGANGQLLYTVDASGAVEENVYDQAGRVIKTVKYANRIGAADLDAMWSWPWPSDVEALLVPSAQDAVEHRVLDRNGRLVATVDGTGAVVKYTYDGAGNVIERIAYAKNLSGYVPGTVPNPASDPAHDQRIRTVYDKLNRAIYTVDATGAVVATQYDADGRVLLRTAYAKAIPAGTAATQAAMASAILDVADPSRDQVLRQTYDKAGRLVYVVDGLGAVTKRAYDADGNLRQLKQYANPIGSGDDPATVSSSAADRTTTYTYDKAGRNIYVLDALGSVVKNDYDANGRLTQQRAYAARPALSMQMPDTSDIAGALTPDAANDRITRHAYDAAGRQVYSVDGGGAITQMTYDAIGRVVRTRVYAQAATQASLAALPPAASASAIAGLVSENPAQDRTTHNVFDAAGQLRYTVDGAGYVRETRYDGVGRTTKTILYSLAITPGNLLTLDAIQQALLSDPAARTDSFSYDGAGNLLSTQDSLGHVETFTYDAVGNKKTFTNKKGDRWDYDHDAAGRMVRETAPQVSVAAVAPNGSGQLVSEGLSTADRQIVTLLTYDALGNLLSRTEAAGLGEQRITRYEYDQLGRQVKTIYPEVDVYDAVNDTLTSSGLAPRVEAPKTLTTITAYDALGNAVAGKDLAGNWSYKVYDQLGRVTHDIDALGFIAAYTRNAFGEVTDLDRFGSAATVPAAEAQGITQLQAGAMVLALRFGQSVVRSLRTDYDQRGLAVKVTEPAVYTYTTDAATNSGTPSVASRVTTNTYNAFGQLTRAVVGGAGRTATTDHFYDRVGLEVATVDAMGYLTTQSFDAAGQVLTRTEYATSVGGGDWGAQPVSASAPAAPAQSADDRTTSYAYDALGRKTSETRVAIQATGEATPVSHDEGTFTLSSTIRRPSMVFDDPGSYGIAGVAFYGGADGTGVLRWPTPPADTGTQAVLRWRRLPAEGEQPQAWQSAGEFIVDEGNGMQHLATAADLPAGEYQVELTYQQAGEVVIARQTGKLTVLPPNVTTTLVGMPSSMQVVPRTVPGLGPVQVLQWPAPGAGMIASLQFQPPGGTGEWLRATVVTDGAVQYVVIPPGLPAGTYALRADVTALAPSLVNATTSYDYDAVGNLVRTEDAAGNSTYSYYDALGRVKAVVTPPVTGLAGPRNPLTEYYRDAFGNVVGSAERAQGATGVSLDGYTRVSTDPADHVQGFAYDRFGHMVQSTDAEKVNHYYSYNERGDLAKTWQSVTDPYLHTTSTIWQQLEYDKLGRLVTTREPGPTQLDGSIGTVTSEQIYNAYGEVVEKRVNKVTTEFFDYDAAGRVWRTNAGDGTVRVMLYDALGNATLDLRSDGSGGSNIDLKSQAIFSADAALGYAASLRQTLTVYDKLGHAIRQVLPQKLEGATNVSLQQASAWATNIQSGTVGQDPTKFSDLSLHWLTPNNVTLTWSSLANLGSGDVKVELGYVTKTVSGKIEWDEPSTGNPQSSPYTLTAANRSLTRIMTSEDAATGATFSWNDDIQYAGIDQITSLRVSKKGLDGQWHLIFDQGATAKPVNMVLVDRPQDMGAATVTSTGQPAAVAPVVEVKLQARLAGSGNGWGDMTSLVDFGKKLNFDASGLPDGTYDYRVLTRRAGDAEAVVTSTGSVSVSGTVVAQIDTPILTGNKGLGVYDWQTPAAPDTVQVFHYRPAGSAGAWLTLPVDNLGGGYSGVNASLLPTGTYEYELSYTHGTAITPYARTSGTITTVAASGTPTVDGFSFTPNADGTSVMHWRLPPGATSVLTYRRMDSADPAVPVPWAMSTSDGVQTVTTPNTLAPGQYKLDLTLKVGDAVVAHSSATLTIGIGATEAPSCSPVPPETPYVPAYTTPASGTPPVDQVEFFPADNGDWTVSWTPVAGLRTEFWMRQHGTTTWEPKTSRIVLSGGKESVTILDAEAPPGLWDIEVRQFGTGTTPARLSAGLVTTYADGTIAPVLFNTTPAYVEQQNFPWLDTTWAAPLDGSWSITWNKNADPLVSVVVKWRKAGTGATWKYDDSTWLNGGAQDNGSTWKVSGTTSMLGPEGGAYELAIFEVKNNTVVGQRLQTLTLKPGTYAAATRVETTPTYYRSYSWNIPQYAPLVPGITWQSTYPGSTFTWATPGSGFATAVNYRSRATGEWRTLDPIAFQTSGGTQTLRLDNTSALTDGVWDAQITQFDIASGAVIGNWTGVMTVSGGNTVHQLTSTFPGVVGFSVDNQDKGGTIVSWSQPPQGYTAKFYFAPAGTTNWTEYTSSATSANIPAGWNPGNYEVKVELKDALGMLIQYSSGHMTLTTNGFGNTFSSTTPGNTVIYSSVPIGVPQIAAAFNSNATTGDWSLQWTKPTSTQPTLRYKLKNSGIGWTTANSKITTSGSTVTASFSGMDLSPGIYEVDIFYGSETQRTWQYTADVTVTSKPVSPTKRADNTPAYVPASGIPMIPVRYDLVSSTVWRLAWEALPVGQTMTFKAIDPLGKVIDYTGAVQTNPDGTQYLLGPVGMDAGVYQLELKFYSNGTTVKQAMGTFTFAQNDVKAGCDPVATDYTPPVYHPQEGIAPVPGLHFDGTIDGTATLSWTHPPAGGTAELWLRQHGTVDWLPATTLPKTTDGVDWYTLHAWDLPGGCNWDLGVRIKDAAGNVTAQSIGTLVMAPMGTVAPGLQGDPAPAYTAASYYVTQQAGKASQTYVPAGDQTLVPGFAVQPMADGGSRFVWNQSAVAGADVFSFRPVGNGTPGAWITPTPEVINETGTPQSVVYMAASFAAGQYEMELTRTVNGVVSKVTGSMFVVAAAPAGPAGPSVTQSDAGNAPAPTLQATISRSFDRWGNMLSASDARYAGWVTQYAYNANNQLVKQTQPDGSGNVANAAVTSILYDVLGRQVAVIDANGNMNRQIWDAAGNLVSELHADGGEVTYSYDVFGNKVRMVAKANANTPYTTSYAYDRLNRLTTTTYQSVAASRYSVDPSGAYVLMDDNPAGQPLAETDTWDEAGRKTGHTGTGGQETQYQYDLRGNVIANREAGVVTRMAYDAQGRMTAQQDGNGAVATWRYDYFGKLDEHWDIGGAKYTYSYDNARQLIAQVNTRANANGQLAMNVSYRYDRAGNLVELNDLSTGTAQTFAYDLAGRRVRETTAKEGVTYRDNYLAYDALGRLALVEDGRAQVRIEYDKVGNRSRIKTHVITTQADTGALTQVEGAHDSDAYFRYDAMNRQTVANARADGTLGEEGHRLTYDWLGNKTSDSWRGQVITVKPGTSYTVQRWGANDAYNETTVIPTTYQAQVGETTELYSYDALGRLADIQRDGTLVEHRQYDRAGRLTQAGPGALASDYLAALYGTYPGSNQPLPGNGTETKKNAYDGNGRLVRQLVQAVDGRSLYELDYRKDRSAAAAAQGEANDDLAGNLQGYVVKDLQVSDNTKTYAYHYQWMEGYKNDSVSVQRGSATSSNWTRFDGNGFVINSNDNAQAGSERIFVNDEGGRAVYVRQGSHVQRQLIVNGEVLGRYGEVVDETKPKTASAPSFTTVADFNFGFQSTAGNTPEGQERSHVVSAGDTLQSVAKSYYGDERLWYRLADANGVSGNAELKAGQLLKIPSLEASGNAANTFRPYDPSKVQGDNTPYIPGPPPKKKSFFKQLVAIVVAVVVAYFTGFELATYFGVNMTTVSASSVAVASTAAAAGSVAGQVTGMALGVQDRFSWKQVALSALSAGVGQGIGGELGIAAKVEKATNSAFLGSAAQAAVGNAITQGVGVVTGLQSKFDWRGVVASAAGAAVGQVVGNAVNGVDFRLGQFGNDLASGTLRGLAAGATAAAVRGGKVAIQQVAVDAFGNALGSSIASLSWDNTQLSTGDFARMDGEKYRSIPYGEMPNATTGLQPTQRSGLGLNVSAKAVQDWSDEIEGGARLIAARDAEIDAAAAAQKAQVRQAELQAKAQKATSRAGMSNEQAYALYMSNGGRSGSYARAGVSGASNSAMLSLTPSASVASTGAATFSLNGGGAGISLGQAAVGAAELLGTGFINGIGRIGAGVASVPALGVMGVDGAVDYFHAAQEQWSIQSTSVGAQAIQAALLPAAQRMAGAVQAARDYSTNLIGDGATTTLFAAGQIGFESWATATGMRAGAAALADSGAVIGPLASRGMDNLMAPRRLNSQFGGVTFGNTGNAPAQNIVYRALTEADATSIANGGGLVAKAPEGTWTAAEHVANSGPGAGGAAANSPWISTTRSLDVAQGYNGGNGIIAIDLNQVDSLQVEVWQKAPRVNGVDGLPYHRSIWAQEVTVYQTIPPKAIVGPVKTGP